MDKIKSVSNSSFADAEFRSFEFNINNSSLIVYLSSWDNKILKCIFSDMIQFTYKPGDVVYGIYELLKNSLFFEEAIRLHYEKIPVDHLFKHFQIIDIQDFSFIEVVARTVHVIKERPLDTSTMLLES